MACHHLYLVRHGLADAFGTLTDTGRAQARLLGERLSGLPLDAVWHSPLPRACATAEEMAVHLPDVPMAAADELMDNIPHVPEPAQTPSNWTRVFDGYDSAEATAGRRRADALVNRFARPPEGSRPVHELLITHAYPIAWLLRHALDAPPARWLGLIGSANTGLTVIDYCAGLPPTVGQFNDLSHLTGALRWTGFGPGPRP